MSDPKKWHEVYPYGTKEGSEESKLFRALSRSKFDWRSIKALVAETQLDRKRVEEIINKYAFQTTPPLIVQSSTNDENWAYWERVKTKKDTRSISEKDKDKRIDRQLQTP